MSAEHRRRRTPPAPAAAGCRKRKATASTVWAAVHTERRALVEDLTDLTERQWETPSLCQDWAVRDVVAHLAATATLTRGGFARELAAARLSTQRIVDRQISRTRARDAAASLAALRSAIYDVASPPRPLITRVVEILVHAEDIRQPLGVHRAYPLSWVVAALLHLAGDRSSGGRVRLAGLTLAATDTLFISGTVIANSSKTGTQWLPFFSKLNLMQQGKQVRSLGFGLSISRIDIEP